MVLTTSVTGSGRTTQAAASGSKRPTDESDWSRLTDAGKRLSRSAAVAPTISRDRNRSTPEVHHSRGVTNAYGGHNLDTASGRTTPQFHTIAMHALDISSASTDCISIPNSRSPHHPCAANMDELRLATLPW